ncbi:MAG: linear amide C-N hydrolase [Bacteroidales bacterium]
MKRILPVSILILCSLMSFACTTFTLKDSTGNIVFGRNFDFPVGIGHIEINDRGLQKTALIMPPEIPITWVSKYGSITFNQAGKEFPYGGMNEAGLVIEQMWLGEAQYPDPDQRYGLNELQWIQYQLDNSATVKDVTDSDSLVRISKSATSLIHFLVSDALGNTAAIEFINGKMVIHEQNELPFSVLSNCTYANSLLYKSSIDHRDNQEFNEWTKNSSGRFVTASRLISDYQNQEIVDYAWLILDSVAQPGSTQWSIVYDISGRKIHFSTSGNPQKQVLEMHRFDFSCSSDHLYANITDEIRGPEDFRKLTFEENFRVMDLVVSSVGFLQAHVTKEALTASAGYFETVQCQNP